MVSDWRTKCEMIQQTKYSYNPGNNRSYRSYGLEELEDFPDFQDVEIGLKPILFIYLFFSMRDPYGNCY